MTLISTLCLIALIIITVFSVVLDYYLLCYVSWIIKIRNVLNGQEHAFNLDFNISPFKITKIFKMNDVDFV